MTPRTGRRARRSAAALGLGALARLGEAGPRTNSSHAKIFVYDLPECSFEHFPPEDIDGGIWGLHDGRPPALPIHRRLLASRYVTKDPERATLFYVPAPFFLWDSSWALMERGPRCPAPGRELARQIAFDGAGAGVLELEGEAPSGPSGGRPERAWTVSLWARLGAEVEGGGGQSMQVLLSAGKGSRCALGLAGACPVLWGCRASSSSPSPDDAVLSTRCGLRPDASMADGRWHALAVSYDGETLRFYLDGITVGEAAVDLEVPGGWSFYGGSASGGEAVGSNFRGEARGLKLYRKALHTNTLMLCNTAEWRGEELGYSVPEALSPASGCFQAVRRHVEAQPWLRRRGGWDHFVLFAGADYPRAFDPVHAPQEEHYVLEHAWPAFAHFSLLTFGARPERCFGWHSQFPDSFADAAKKSPKCVRRLFRAVTIPPLLEGEPFDCRQLETLLESKRPTRVAYRGLAYSAMPERNAFRNLLGEFTIEALRETREVRLEFSNFTHERVKDGLCSPATAFEGLCSWKSIGADAALNYGVRRARAMRQWSLGMWAKSDTCLVLPGDGGYELRLYSMIGLGCVPVVVTLAGVNFPKLPFSAQLPWNDFAIFWVLGGSGMEDEVMGYEQTVLNSAHAIILQLASVGADTLRRKRQALFRYAHALRWAEPCGGEAAGGGQPPSTLDLVVNELMHRAKLPEDTSAWSLDDWQHKVPSQAMSASMVEDVTGNGCPLGFPICARAEMTAEPWKGDYCYSATRNMGIVCPHGCYRVREGGPRCVGPDGTPCKSSLCLGRARLPQAFALLRESEELQLALGHNTGWVGTNSRLHVWDWEPRLALVTSGARPAFAELTRPSVERFLAAHPGRYEAFLDEPPLLDERDYALAWNKLALMRRTMRMDDYDAVVWLDDDVLITDPEADPIYDGALGLFERGTQAHAVLSARAPGDRRVPFDTGIMVLRNSVQGMRLLEDTFRIGRKRARIRGETILPKKEGLFDEDALAIYVLRRGSELFSWTQHGYLQSAVGPGRSLWEPGHFAAHVTSEHGEQRALELLRDLVRRNAPAAA